MMNKHTRDIMVSSDNTEWEAPGEVYLPLHKEFGFNLDATATEANSKCVRYFTKKRSCLDRDWPLSTAVTLSPTVVWMNPPYNKPELACLSNCTKKTCQKRGWHRKHNLPGQINYVRKAWEQSQRGMTVVLLIPARTDTGLWHKYIWDKKKHQPRPGVEMRLKEGRIKFKGATAGAVFPSAIIIFRRIE